MINVIPIRAQAKSKRQKWVAEGKKQKAEVRRREAKGGGEQTPKTTSPFSTSKLNCSIAP
jgi:hypothetical protein